VVVGWVGRLSREKGPDLAVEAIRGLVAPAVLVIVGDGPELERVVRQAREMGVTDQVRTLGTRANVWETLPAFDLLLLSSRTEGTPMILLEAIHAGLPIVATPVGGVPDLLDDQAGWLAASASAGDLRTALAAALADPAESQVRAARAKARLLERHSSTQWVERHLALYGQVLAGRAA
jgi:glycosyltransferase involved in cell wall biosynthesis